MDIHAERILIIDFGSQYTELIARRVRESGVYCEVHPYTIGDTAIAHFKPSGVILSGGHETVTAEETPRIPAAVFNLGCPVLGICYGMQAMALQLGGTVGQDEKREFGYAKVTICHASLLLDDIEDDVSPEGDSLLDVWMSHGDHVETLPPSFQTIASTAQCPIVGMADDQRKWYGLQFHPEVFHTKQGKRIFERFVLAICGCRSNWTPKNIIEEQIKAIQHQVGQEHVLLGLSGGVDSSVAAVLLHRAIGSQLHCMFIDTGLLRLNEAERVKAIFAKHIGIKLITIDASERFLKALTGVSDPEQKRKIVGKLFIDIFEEEAKKIPAITWLAQGTIYSDVIESAATKAGQGVVIKSHHNVGGLPDNMKLRLIEPLRELFKDEVREIGELLGLPDDIVYCHPFPGPGLGVRVLGEIKPEYLHKLRLADAVLIDELRKQDLYRKVSQAFAVFLPVKSVGVLGDARHYDHVIAIRVVETVDFMTAHWSHLPYDFLATVSNRIINEVPGISRVTYDISSKPPATIEWE
jgi:GMP synthase (glutamine-hydrolysing)